MEKIMKHLWAIILAMLVTACAGMGGETAGSSGTSDPLFDPVHGSSSQ
jgi:hypothetical protein